MTHRKCFLGNDTEPRKGNLLVEHRHHIVTCVYCHLLFASIMTESPSSFPREGHTAFPSRGPVPFPSWPHRRQRDLGLGLGNRCCLVSSGCLDAVGLGFRILTSVSRQITPWPSVSSPVKWGEALKCFVGRMKRVSRELATRQCSVQINCPPFPTFWKPRQRNTEFSKRHDCVQGPLPSRKGVPHLATVIARRARSSGSVLELSVTLLGSFTPVNCEAGIRLLLTFSPWIFFSWRNLLCLGYPLIPYKLGFKTYYL